MKKLVLTTALLLLTLLSPSVKAEEVLLQEAVRAYEALGNAELNMTAQDLVGLLTSLSGVSSPQPPPENVEEEIHLEAPGQTTSDKDLPSGAVVSRITLDFNPGQPLTASCASREERTVFYLEWSPRSRDVPLLVNLVCESQTWKLIAATRDGQPWDSSPLSKSVKRLGKTLEPFSLTFKVESGRWNIDGMRGHLDLPQGGIRGNARAGSKPGSSTEIFWPSAEISATIVYTAPTTSANLPQPTDKNRDYAGAYELSQTALVDMGKQEAQRKSRGGASGDGVQVNCRHYRGTGGSTLLFFLRKAQEPGGYCPSWLNCSNSQSALRYWTFVKQAFESCNVFFPYTGSDLAEMVGPLNFPAVQFGVPYSPLNNEAYAVDQLPVTMVISTYGAEILALLPPAQMEDLKRTAYDIARRDYDALFEERRTHAFPLILALP